ncbi:uncharacterized protein LOC136094859 [Hydra vulgaris]|uniref:uncharacterized protein LOC136094859 n=1 Tax=Hydra vulgaris TaxID=6087 RepID=UPI0032EA8AF4
MRKDQKAHANSSTQDHLSMAISKLVFLENKILTNENETTKKLSVLEKEMGKDQGECRKSSNEEMSTKLNALEDKINCLAKEVIKDQDKYRKSSNEEMSTKLNALEDKINCLAKEVVKGFSLFKVYV